VSSLFLEQYILPALAAEHQACSKYNAVLALDVTASAGQKWTMSFDTSLVGSQAARRGNESFNLSSVSIYNEETDEHYISGCHGTLAEQQSEEHYDNRWNSEDDLSKGMITFPVVKNRGRNCGYGGEERTKLYARTKELKMLRKLYGEVCSACDEGDNEESINSSSLVYISGYEKVGKTALISEFIDQPNERRRARSKDVEPLLYVPCTIATKSDRQGPLQELFDDLKAAAIDLWNNPPSSGVGRTERQSYHINEESDDSDSNSVGSFTIDQLEGCDEQAKAVESAEEQRRRLSESIEQIKPETQPSPESVSRLVKFICSIVGKSPFVLYLDNLQNLQHDNEAMLVVQTLLIETSTHPNLIIVLSYIPTKDSALVTLLENIESQRGYSDSKAILKIGLVPFSYETTLQFCMDTVKNENRDEVCSLAQAVYQKTLGIAGYVRYALEEACYYDVMMFSWTWTPGKLASIEDYLPDLERLLFTLQLQLKRLPVEAQRILMVMACVIQSTISTSTLRGILVDEGFAISDDELSQHLQLASREGFLSTQASCTVSFSHDYIHQAVNSITGKDEQSALLLRILDNCLDKWNTRLSDAHLDAVYEKDNDYALTSRERHEMIVLMKFLDVDESCARDDTHQTPTQRQHINPLSESMTSTTSRAQRAHPLLRSWSGYDQSKATKGKTHHLKQKGSRVLNKFLSSNCPSAESSRYQRATGAIFYPSTADPKSSLLKFGSIRLVNNEAFLLVFTHGFVVANVVEREALELFLALNKSEILTSDSFSSFLESKFRVIEKESGVLSKALVAEVFHSMGFPSCDSIVSRLVGDGNTSHLTCETLCNSWRHYCSQIERDKRSTSQRRKIIEACLFSYVLKIECVDSQRFAMTLKDRVDEPLIFSCSSTTERDEWMTLGFRPLLYSVEQSMGPRDTRLQQPGWQHLVIRSTYSSLVVLGDHAKLEEALANCTVRRRREELDMLDEFNGYTPLHYAVIADDVNCIEILIRYGANLIASDSDGLNPMIHAVRLSGRAADVLERHGACREEAVKALSSGRLKSQTPSMVRLSDEEMIPDATAVLKSAASKMTSSNRYKRDPAKRRHGPSRRRSRSSVNLRQEDPFAEPTLTRSSSAGDLGSV